jgi:hypothetical protein
MAVGSNGYRVALVSRQRTPGRISSSSGTAGLRPSISFSTSYPELPPMPDWMARRLRSQRACAGGKPGSSGARGARRDQEAVGTVLVSRHAEPGAAADGGSM